jgi:hypothetical protein
VRFSHKLLYFIVSGIVCLYVLASGCSQIKDKTTKIDHEPPPEKKSIHAVPAQPVMLALKFTPQDLIIYRVITEAQKSVTWQGPLAEKPSAFKGGQTNTKVEMTFSQQVQSVDDEGNAVEEITIKDLTYLVQVANNVVLDFDSSKVKEPNSPLMNLIGQSYTIEISPSGEVLRIIDKHQAQAKIKGKSREHNAASQLLADEVIKQRHTVVALTALKDKNRLSPGDKWNEIETLSFDMMGSKTYDKIYTLKKVKDINDHLVAVAEMNAIPSTELAEDVKQNQQTNIFSKMFDNVETYTGRLKFDLTACNVQQFQEKLETEWIIADPNPKQGEEPSVIRMKAVRFYSMERVD